ncbi:hypothetical protein QUF76_08950 [Desulfobacterales bacterium HSG16]|nr:hypothetical protein [Desulfobacterales bacterium HSG16]
MTRMMHGRSILICIAIAALFFMVTGCSVSQFRGRNYSSSSTAQKAKKPSPVYYDFGDVLIPSELKLDKKSCFTYQTPGFSAGVLSLKGRVDIKSLISFFENNMARDNWQIVSSFKSPRTMMLFHKESRWCVISINEKEFNTYTEIWVSPTATDTEEGLMK